MKRHPSLQDLSREHHMLLTHARELRWSSEGHGDLAKACKEFLKYWNERGLRHFELEERKLFPFCERRDHWHGAEEIGMVYEQHEEIRKYTSDLEEKIKKEGDLQKGVSELARLLEKHVRYEERIVFEMIQKSLTEDELLELRDYLSVPRDE